MMSQFCQFLDLHHCYGYSFISPAIFSMARIRKLLHMVKLSLKDDTKTGEYQDCDIVVYDFWLSNCPKFLETRNFNNTNFLITWLLIDEMTLTPDMIFFMLSTNIKDLCLKNVIFTGPIKFSEILLAAPNIIEISLGKVNIKMDDNWPILLTQSKIKDAEICLKIKLNDINFEQVFQCFRYYRNLKVKDCIV